MRFDSVVMLAPYTWVTENSFWQTPHQIARELARHYPVLFVEPAPQWDPRSDWHRQEGLLRGVMAASMTEAQENLHIFHRCSVPFGRFEVVRNFDLRRNARSLTNWLNHNGFRKPLLWHSFPYWSEPLVDAAMPEVFAYHCLDYALRAEEESRLVKRADAVFCVSNALVEKYLPRNPNTYLLPNGVNLNLFDANRVSRGIQPAGIPRQGRLIGMIGAINYQLDYELIVRVAQAFPRDQVIMGGKTLGKNSAPSGNQLAALQRLQQMSNVHMLGFIPPTKVPSYVKAFDVCLMPFIQHRSIEECDPLKFYEFMAMGKPVVTTPVPVTRDHPDLAYVANSREEFIRLVGDVLDHPEPESKSSRRVEFAQAHDWSAIVETALSVLQRIDGKKAATSHA